MNTVSYLPWQFINGEDVSTGILEQNDWINKANFECEAAQIEPGQDNDSSGVNGDTVSDHAHLLFDVLCEQQLLLDQQQQQLDALSEMVHGGTRKSYVHDVACERCSGEGHGSDVCSSGRRFRSGRRSRFVRGQGRRDANVSLNGHPPSDVRRTDVYQSSLAARCGRHTDVIGSD
jgi:hypothetical protein